MLYDLTSVHYPPTLQENFIGENQNFKVFNSALSRRPPAPPQPQEEDPKPKLTDETPVYPADYIKEPDDRFIEVHVEFKLHNLTGEFPTVSEMQEGGEWGWAIL